ncbi:MAG: class II fumarate hydratase [Clostridia bacterium]|nr:class II fumarate hydratase [Clostridia bacterium]
MDFRIEHDSMGEVEVDSARLWGAQTERSRRNFKIGEEKMPREIIRAFAVLKSACAEANCELGRLSGVERDAIARVCYEISLGALDAEFPLSVWQTGSGTQTNMNLNEVIANRGNALLGKKTLHPNDTVNMSQSSNDTFPSAMRIAAVCAINERLVPAAERLIEAFLELEKKNADVIKVGRTHLQDAVPLTLAQEISGWRSALETSLSMVKESRNYLYSLALGGTAVGTGLNAPEGFDSAAVGHIAKATGYPFTPADNKFRALTSLSDMAFSHGALRALACDLMKIANDIRLLSSGPRCGIGELLIPENEPGSSIMPGKVNPTQCEMVTMVAARVMGNDTTVSVAASQGNFQLNVYLPVTAYTFLQSVTLLADAMGSFTDNCVVGIKPNKKKISENLERSLMLVTALSGSIGYENAARVAKCAHAEDITLAEAAEKLGLLSKMEAEKLLDPQKMV